jgi:Holliday junction resolvasome RuvABC endonuclease subunit
VRTVIGVDPSLTCTGVAVWQEGRVTTFYVKTKRDDGPRVVRERKICGAIMPWISFADQDRRSDDGRSKYELPETLVIIEAVHQSRMQTGRTALDLAGLHDVLVYGFHARGLTVGVASPQLPKIMATGRGNASKPQMVEAAEREFGITVSTSDEADAAWLMAAGVRAGGGTVNGWPRTWDKARQDSLDKMDWIGDYEQEWLGARDE